MFWMSKDPAKGYLHCDGSSFDRQKYPNLHSFLLRNYPGYTSGYTPEFYDTWCSSVGPHNSWGVGKKVESLTKKPTVPFKTNETGSHTHKFATAAEVQGSKSSGRMYYDTENGLPTSSAGEHQHSITDGGDGITRPPSLIGYWIIKHD
jgi:hypothetical protein